MTDQSARAVIALVIATVIALVAHVAVTPSRGGANPDRPIPSTMATRGHFRQMRVPEPAGDQG